MWTFSQIPSIWKVLLQDISVQTQRLSLWHQCWNKAFKGKVTAVFSSNLNEKASCNTFPLNAVFNKTDIIWYKFIKACTLINLLVFLAKQILKKKKKDFTLQALWDNLLRWAVASHFHFYPRVIFLNEKHQCRSYKDLRGYVLLSTRDLQNFELHSDRNWDDL